MIYLMKIFYLQMITFRLEKVLYFESLLFLLIRSIFYIEHTANAHSEKQLRETIF